MDPSRTDHFFMTAVPQALLADLLPIGEGRLGLSARHRGTVEVPDSSPELGKALQRFADGIAWPIAVRDLTSENAESLAKWLHHHHLVTSAPPRPLTRRRIRLYGDDPLADELATELLAAGVRELTVTSPELYDRLKANAEQLHIGPLRARPILRLDTHWLVDHRHYDLAVVTGPGVEPDRAILADLARNAIPALLVLVHRGVAQLGPLFSPQGGGCWRCFDLTRTDLDWRWPRVLAELQAIPAKQSVPLVRWASAQASIEISSYLSGTGCDLVDTTLSWDQSSPGLLVSEWPQNERCLCAQAA